MESAADPSVRVQNPGNEDPVYKPSDEGTAGSLSGNGDGEQ